MAVNRSGIKVTDGSTSYRFSLSPTGKGGRGLTIQTRAWEPGDPQQAWRVPLHPWDAGLNSDRLTNKRAYAKANADTSYNGLLLFPPAHNAVTLTNAVLPDKVAEFNSLMFMRSGRYAYYFDPSANTATEDEDLGVGNAITDIEVFNGELVAAMGESVKLYTRNTAGTWTQATDATYATALGVVGSRLWRSESTNKVSSATTAPRTLTSWTPASPNQYTVGDSTYAINTIIDYGGVPWVGKADGMYSPDPASRFINQTPQLRKYPHVDNCFPADTKVSWIGRLERVFRRWYEGAMVEIATATGDKLSGTPNHPVLTDRGWVGLGFLKEGDRIVRRSGGQGVALAQPDVQHVDTSIGEMFDALAGMAGGAQRKDGTVVDFHGDGQDREVDVVAVEGPLRDWFEATFPKPYSEFILPDTHELPNALSPLSPPAHLFDVDGLATSGLDARARDSSLLLGSEARHVNLHGLGSRPHLDASCPQPTGNGVAREFVLDGEPVGADTRQVVSNQIALGDISPATRHLSDNLDPSLGALSGGTPGDLGVPLTGGAVGSELLTFGHSSGGFPGLLQAEEDGALAATKLNGDGPSTEPLSVEFDHIVSIHVRAFSGHVYNLQSQFNKYTANGIVVHNCKGAFVAQGFLFVPSSAGLIRIKPGQSKIIGPELVGRPGYRFWVRGGVEFGGVIWLLCTDEGAVDNTFICKMVRDDEGLSGREYRFYEWCRLGATTKGYFIGVSTKGTNPELVVGFGNNMKYIKLGRGGGRDIDDSNYAYGTAMELETGKVMPSADLGVVSVLQGVATVLDYSAAGESLSVSYKVDGDGAYSDLLTTSEGGGTAAISSTTNFQAVTRYAPTTAIGQFFEFKFTGSLTSASGTNRPEILEAWAFGYSRPRVTDVISMAIHAGPGTAAINGIPNGQSAEETIRLFRNWMESSTVLTVEIPEYEQGRTTRFLVTNVEVAEQEATIGQQHPTTASRVMVALTRVDYAGAFADA